MNTPSTVEKQVHLSVEQADRLQHLAEVHQMSEDELIARALDVFFSLAQVSDDSLEGTDWALLSEESLRRIWDNDQDAVYDNWRELYDVPTGSCGRCSISIQ